MILQILMVLWLFAVFQVLAYVMGISTRNEKLTSYIASAVWIAMPVVILYYNGFWIIN